ncbi:galanin receptor type 2 [Callorhinchus milii]|uniref:galanin receptor type 2 n=1 Tax=Callorhinchus milii TaxID=7868 RepID=UPI001C3F89BF|nr:galanin receptor type 2 [Callorhinchus milii]
MEGNGSWSQPEVWGLRAETVVVPALFSLILALGTAGNVLVVAALLRQRHRHRHRHSPSTTELFILNLALADLGFLLCCVPFQATIYTLRTWLFGSFLCKAVHFIIFLSMYSSVYTLTAVSVDRSVPSHTHTHTHTTHSPPCLWTVIKLSKWSIGRATGPAPGVQKVSGNDFLYL